MFKRIVALIVLFFFIATSNYGWAQSNYGKKEPANVGVDLEETIIRDKAIKPEHLGKERIYSLNIKTKSDENQIIQKYNSDKVFLKNLLEQNKDEIDLAIADKDSNLNQKLELYLVDLTAFLSSKIIKENNEEEYNKANEFQDGIKHFNLLSMLQTTIINYLYWKNTAIKEGNLSSEVQRVFLSYLYSNLIYLTKDNYRIYIRKKLPSILEMSNYKLPSELNTFLERFHSQTIVLDPSKTTTTSIEELYKNIFLNAQRINIKNYIYSYYVYKTSNSGLNIDKVAEELCRTKENSITKIAVEGLKNNSNARTGFYYQTNPATEEAEYSELIIDCKQELSNFGNKYLSQLKEKEKNPVTIINTQKYLGDVNRYARIVNEFNEYVKSINQVIETFNTQLKNTIHNGKYLQPSSFKTVREYRSYLENYFNGEGKGLIKDYYTSINNLSQTYPISRFIMADKGFFGMHKVFYQDPNREVKGLEEKSDFELTGEKPVYTGNETTYIENNPDLLNYLPDFKKALKSQWTDNSQRWDDFVYQYLDEILKYGKGLSSAYNEYSKIENDQSSKINTSAKNIAEILKVQSLAVIEAVQYDGVLLDKINYFFYINKKIKEIDANEKRKEELHKVLGYVGLAAGVVMLATGIMSWAGAGAAGTSAAVIEGINIASMLLLTSYGYYELEVLKDKQEQLNKQIIAEKIDIEKLTSLSIEVQNLKIYAVMTFAALPLDFLMIPQITGFLRTVKNIKVWNTMIDLVGYKHLDALENLTKYLSKKESTQFLMYLSDGGFDVETIIKITENNKLLKNEDLINILKKQFHKENTPSVIKLINEETDTKKTPIFKKTDVTEKLNDSNSYLEEKTYSNSENITDQNVGSHKKKTEQSNHKKGAVIGNSKAPAATTPITKIPDETAIVTKTKDVNISVSGISTIDPCTYIPKNQAEYEKVLSLLPDNYLIKQTLRERTLMALWNNGDEQFIKLLKSDYIDEMSVFKGLSNKKKSHVIYNASKQENPIEFFKAVDQPQDLLYYEAGKGGLHTGEVKVPFYIERKKITYGTGSFLTEPVTVVQMHGSLNGGIERIIGVTAYKIEGNTMKLYWTNVIPEARGMKIGTEMLDDILKINSKVNRIVTNEFAFTNMEVFMKTLIKKMNGNPDAVDIALEYKKIKEDLINLATDANKTRRHSEMVDIGTIVSPYDNFYISGNSEEAISQIIKESIESTPSFKRMSDFGFEVNYARVNLSNPKFGNEIVLEISFKKIK